VEVDVDVAIEVEVEPESGRVSIKRAVAAVDSGEIVNPDGIRNQIEGGIIQSISWTLFESVSFDEQTVTSTDWATYPIARFASVPDAIDVRLIDRPGQPFLGAGEAAQGPAAAAVVNAIADAVRRRLAPAGHEGPRLRDIPVTPERIRALFARRP